MSDKASNSKTVNDKDLDDLLNSKLSRKYVKVFYANYIIQLQFNDSMIVL